MGSNRVVYQNWIVELGGDPERLRRSQRWDEPRLESVSLDDPSAVGISNDQARRLGSDDPATADIRARVRQAMEKLDDQEKEFVIQFYFMGRGYRQLSEKSGRPVHKLEALHKRAVKKLRKELVAFVQERFGLEPEPTGGCAICRSPHVDEIDRIIRGRDRRATWRPVIKLLREVYGLKVSSPQILIGHEKYHSRGPTRPVLKANPGGQQKTE